MLCGDPPFRAQNKKKLFDLIMGGRVKWPRYLSTNAVDLLKKLLTRSPDKRFGAGKSSMFEQRGVSAIKAHAFFNDRRNPAPFDGSSSR